MLSQNKPFTLDRVVRLSIALVIFSSIIWLLGYLSNVLIPFVIALILAYMINPLVLFVQNKMKVKKRGISVMIALLFISTGFSLFASLSIPLFIREIRHLGELLGKFLNDSKFNEIVTKYVPDNLWEYIKNLLSSNDLNELLNSKNLEQAFTVFYNKILPVLMNFFSGSISFLFSSLGLTIIFLYLFFILIDYEDISNSWKGMIPKNYRNTFVTITEDLISAMNKYFKAQLTVAISIGILFAVGFAIIGLPMGILFGLSLGIMNMIPYMQLLGIPPAIMLALMYSLETGTGFWWMIFLVCMVFLIVQLIQDVFIYPKVMGDVTGLNSAAILLSLSIWGKLLGMLGLILAIPFTYILLNYYKKFLEISENDSKEQSEIPSEIAGENQS